jgi:PST family polysaccharide transporter
VFILFGRAWLEAAPLVAMFSVTAAYLPVLLTGGLLYMTQGRTGEMVRATLIDGALCVGAIVAGLPWGVVGVAAAIAIVGVLVRLPLSFWLASRRGPVSLGDMLDAIAPATCAGAAGAAMGFALHRFVFPAIEPTPTAVLAVAAAAVAIMLLTALSWPEVRREVVQLARLLPRPRGLRGQPISPQPRL